MYLKFVGNYSIVDEIEFGCVKRQLQHSLSLREACLQIFFIEQLDFRSRLAKYEWFCYSYDIIHMECKTKKLIKFKHDLDNLSLAYFAKYKASNKMSCGRLIIALQMYLSYLVEQLFNKNSSINAILKFIANNAILKSIANIIYMQ